MITELPLGHVVSELAVRQKLWTLWRFTSAITIGQNCGRDPSVTQWRCVLQQCAVTSWQSQVRWYCKHKHWRSKWGCWADLSLLYVIFDLNYMISDGPRVWPRRRATGRPSEDEFIIRGLWVSRDLSCWCSELFQRVCATLGGWQDFGRECGCTRSYCADHRLLFG